MSASRSRRSSCARLRASDDYEADIRLRWAALVRDEAIQGLALHEAFRHLRTALFPDAVHRERQVGQAGSRI